MLLCKGDNRHSQIFWICFLCSVRSVLRLTVVCNRVAIIIILEMIIIQLPVPASGTVPRRSMSPQSVRLYVLCLPLSSANSGGHVLQSFLDFLHRGYQRSLCRLSCRHPHSPESSHSEGVRSHCHCHRHRLSRHSRHHCHRLNGHSLTLSFLWIRRRVRHQHTVSRPVSLRRSLVHLQKWELRPGAQRQPTSQNRVTVTNSSTLRPQTLQSCHQCPRSR